MSVSQTAPLTSNGTLNNNVVRQVAVIAFTVSNWVMSALLGSGLNQSSADANRAYFLPVNGTFAIWGVIFLTELFYAIYQGLPAQRERTIHRTIGGWVALNAALTSGWIVCALPQINQGRSIFVVLTVLFLIGMLFSLTQAFIRLHRLSAELTTPDRWLVRVPVTIFFAWLNVAMIANTAAALIALGFTGEPNGALWAARMLVVATGLASAVILYNRPNIGTIVYTGVVVWAVVGIAANNTDRAPLVVILSLVAAVVVVVVTVFDWLRRRSASSVPSNPA